MVCLICANSTDNKTRYHKNCIKKMFGTDEIPLLNFSLSDINIEAQKMAGKLSISGVQPKISVKLNLNNNSIEPVAESGEYILKPQSQSFNNLPENEFICSILAGKMGINVSEIALLELKGGSFAYIVKRFDRNKGSKIHVEDFIQILGNKDKYKGSYEEIGKKLKTISEVPGFDVQLFFERVLFYYIIGNGDAHLKNFSIIYGNGNRIRLAPAYDIVSSKIVLPDEEDLALTINGKKNHIKKNDFLSFAEYLGINKKYTNEVIEKFMNTGPVLKNISGINDGIFENLCRIIQNRTQSFLVA